MEYIVGADPGRHGAVVVLELFSGKIAKMVPSKMMKNSDVLDYVWLHNELLPFSGKCSAVWMEEVHAIFGTSAGSTFAFGDAFGSLRVVLDMTLNGSQPLEYSPGVHTVQPKVWQKVAWAGIEIIASQKYKDGRPVFLKSGKPKMDVDTKATSLRAAQVIFPGESFILPRCRKPHDGVVDAALIAHYGRVKFLERQAKGSCR